MTMYTACTIVYILRLQQLGCFRLLSQQDPELLVADAPVACLGLGLRALTSVPSQPRPEDARKYNNNNTLTSSTTTA
jgi:hypothetical protein